MTPSRTAHEVVEAVYAELSRRKGLDWKEYVDDEEIVREIDDALATAVDVVLFRRARHLLTIGGTR